jgi:hypothetical protein
MFDVKIESATNVTQFKLTFDKSENNENVKERLITIIGEYHEHSFSCPGFHTITIHEYLKQRVFDNKKCKIILEYNPILKEEEIARIGTFIIQDIYKRDSASNKEIKSRVEGCDIRSNLITRKGQTDLYNKPNLKSRYSTKEIRDTFVKPFFDNGGASGLNSQLQNLDETAKKNMRKYSAKLEKMLSDFDDKKNTSVLELQKIWAGVTDFEVLKQINERGPCDEIIICIGDFHRENISKVLSSWENTEKLSGSDTISDSESCVSATSLKTASDLNSDYGFSSDSESNYDYDSDSSLSSISDLDSEDVKYRRGPLVVRT